MILAAIDRVAFSIGSFTVEWYGIIATTAIVVGLIYGLFEGPRIGLSRDDVLELFLWIIPIAVLFSRIFYVIPRTSEYFPWNSWDAFVRTWAIWEGGITIIGGIVGGILGGVIFWLRKKKTISFGKLVDLVIPILLLCQAIGRWGNFINQEAFGIAITNPNLQWFPFAVFIDRAYGFANGWYAATFFYESMLNALASVGFYVIWRKNKKYPGITGFLYFAWYFLIRGLLEFIRLDAVPITQVLCFVVFPLALVSGAWYMVWTNRKLKKLECALGDETKIENSDIANIKPEQIKTENVSKLEDKNLTPTAELKVIPKVAPKAEPKVATQTATKAVATKVAPKVTIEKAETPKAKSTTEKVAKAETATKVVATKVAPKVAPKVAVPKVATTKIEATKTIKPKTETVETATKAVATKTSTVKAEATKTIKPKTEIAETTTKAVETKTNKNKQENN